MEKTMNRLVVVVTLAVLTWTCGGSPVSPTSPIPSLAPTTPSAPAPQLTYILSGVVFEVTPTGVMPIEGVQVEEYDRHQFATTDANGFYRISGVSAGRIGVGFDKEGYQSSRTTVTVNGDTRFDFQAIRR
jgi:Carboxypeptidase regulatory-like domain